MFQFAQDRGLEVTRAGTQVDFLLYELRTTERVAARYLQGCLTPAFAALCFSKYYERPHPDCAHNGRRVRYAEHYDQELADGQIGRASCRERV